MKISFADLPLYRWRETKAGRVKAQLSEVENMYLVYDERGRYIAAIHGDVIHTLLERIAVPEANA